MGSTAGRRLWWSGSRRRVGRASSPIGRRVLRAALGAAGSAIAAAAVASAASQAETFLARAANVPVAQVLQAIEIEVDRATAGVFGRYRLEGGETAAVASQPAGREIRLGPADEVWFAGIVDLRADGRVSVQRRTPRRLRSAGFLRPALVLVTRHEEPVAPTRRMGAFRSRSNGLRRETHLFLIELVDGRMRMLLDLETRHRSEDGFGGHHVGGLVLRQRDGTTYLEGVRQDNLPASRARCLEPEPYPVRFELTESRFRELPAQPPPSPCG